MNLGREGAASQMERDFGGPSGLIDFFESHSEGEPRVHVLGGHLGRRMGLGRSAGEDAGLWSRPHTAMTRH